MRYSTRNTWRPPESPAVTTPIARITTTAVARRPRAPEAQNGHAAGEHDRPRELDADRGAKQGALVVGDGQIAREHEAETEVARREREVEEARAEASRPNCSPASTRATAAVETAPS